MIKGWRALGDQAEEMGSVPGFGWGRPEHEMVWAVLGVALNPEAKEVAPLLCKVTRQLVLS